MTEVMGKQTDELAIRLAELKQKEQQPYLSDTRKEQIRREIGHISFELSERNKEK